MRDILALALEIEQPPGRLLPVRVFGASYGSAVSCVRSVYGISLHACVGVVCARRARA